VKFWIENREGARIGDVELPEVRTYTDAPVHIFWMSRLFYLQADDRGGYRETPRRPRVIAADAVKLRSQSAKEEP